MLLQSLIAFSNSFYFSSLPFWAALASVAAFALSALASFSAALAASACFFSFNTAPPLVVLSYDAAAVTASWYSYFASCTSLTYLALSASSFLSSITLSAT